MVSPELLRRYPLFGGLTIDQITALAMAAEEIEVGEGCRFFRQDQELHELYLVLDGQVGIIVELPRQQVVTSTIGPGDVFGWSGLVPPHETTAGAKAMTRCHVVRFDCQRIRNTFPSNWQFGCLMMEKMAQVIRERLRDLRMEALPAYVQ
ncbi:MAG: cyclic nucleotide-binding domain-containing protein [Anaerolineae bacterium]